MLAKNDSNLQEAAVAVCHLSLDEKIRQICEAREDYYRRTAGREALLRKTTSERDQAVEKLNQAICPLPTAGVWQLVFCLKFDIFHIHQLSLNFTTLAGAPTATAFSGMSHSTTALAPITALSPM